MESLGRKVAMLTAGILYGLGTILCATSGTMYHLIAARAVAGVCPLFFTFPFSAWSDKLQIEKKLISARRRRTINGLISHSH